MTEQAGIYCRLSLAIMGDTTKVDDQERICRELADARGWTVPDELVWKDNNKSAWRTGVRRRGWEAMLETVRTGQLRNLIVYHGDRMVRQPYDLETLIRLADNGMTITSPTGTRRLDVAEDRFVLRILADVAELESANTSRRKKAGFARMYRDGRAPVPGGRFGRGFGYQADGRTAHPDEAPALVEAAGRVLEGHSLTAIARDLAARGIVSTSGAPLNYQSLRRILTRPRTAGLLADGTPGNWQPVLERETWELVRSVLDGRAPHHGGTPKYLLSGIATCWACEQPVQRQSAGHTLGYGCVTPGCRKVHRNMDHLDGYVSRRVWRLLGHEGNPAPRALERPGLAAELEALTAARAEVAAKVADPAQPHLNLLLARLERLDARLGQLRESSSADTVRLRLIATHRGISLEQFLALPLATRRALVVAYFKVELLPVSRRGPGFNPADVRLTQN